MEQSQIKLLSLTDSITQVVVKQNNFLTGEIHLEKRIFYSIPRSSKNLFFLFHGNEGGLGLNEELLLLNNYDKIKIRFNNVILTTSRLKWLKKGIISPYCDSVVDKQIILKLSEINMDDYKKYEPSEIQENLSFEEVI